MIGALNGFLGITDFFESIADSFMNTWNTITMPIENSLNAISLLGSFTLFPAYIWMPFLGLLAIVIGMVIVKMLNYLPLW